MDRTAAYQILAVILCILLSAFFSASETAYTTLNRIRLKSLANSGNERAKSALKLSENYDILLSTILIGNNIVNIAGASLATIIFTGFLGNGGVTVSTIVMTATVLIFGEVSPKSLAKESPESFAMSVSPVLRFFVFIFTPINFLFLQWKKLLGHIFKKKDINRVTQDELITYVDEAQNGGGIDEQNGELIRSAIEFDDFDANDILTPRVNIVAVDMRTPFKTIADIFLNGNFSRLPVYEESIDNIVGVIHEKDFFRAYFAGETGVGKILKKVSYIGTGMKISDLLKLLQQSKTHMAVVVDEFGGTQGIVTMEDILEELVGDIWDEHDVVIDYFRKITDTCYEVDCSADVDDMFEFFGLKMPESEYDSVTVSGWVMDRLGRIPSAGDSFEFENTQVTVIKAAARHAVTIRVKLPHPIQMDNLPE